jgi:hypothetical protein
MLWREQHIHKWAGGLPVDVCNKRVVSPEWYGRLMICPQHVDIAMESYIFACCDMSSIHHYHKEKFRISLLDWSAYMLEFLIDSVWKVLLLDDIP